MNQTTKTLLQALIDGKTIQAAQTLGVAYEDITCEAALNLLSTGQQYRLRIKPDTIRIGEFDVPEPLTQTPENGDEFWVPDLLDGSAQKDVWFNTGDDRQMLANGLCHSTEEAASIHTEALLSFTKAKP